jgi:hypothetical protein
MIEMYNKIEAVKEQLHTLRLELARQYPQHYNTALKHTLGKASGELNIALSIIQHDIDQECA